MKLFRRLVLSAAFFMALTASTTATAQTYTDVLVNISGIATAAGTVTITLKDQNGDEIGSYEYEAENMDTRCDIVDGLEADDDIAGYKHKVGSNKNETDGTRSSVFRIKIKRGAGAAFTVCVVEDIPGINVNLKDSNGNEIVVVVPEEVDPNSIGPIDVIGEGTAWTKQNITDLDFGEGVFTEFFKVLSDGHIVAFVAVDPLSPLGPEHLWVIGDVVGDDGVLRSDVVISSSNDPLVVDVLVGDVNCDGIINLLDVDPFIEFLSTGDYDRKADINGDGVVNLLDVDPFIFLLSGG